MRRLALLCCLALACTRSVVRPTPATSRLTLEEATALVPKTVTDREGWALDVLTALDSSRVHPDVEAVCSVLAVIEQESTFQANPPVPGLAKLVRRKLEAMSDEVLLGRVALDLLLAGRAAGTKRTFAERLDAVRTERDLDLVFRDLLRYHETEFPLAYRMADLASHLTGRGDVEALNPITTAGSMQVSVRFAVEHPSSKGLEEWEVRDRLYTRAGGVHYGTARLLAWDASYDAPSQRFADYNAGLYSSRNAAFQAQLTTLTGRTLALDGDLLLYDKHGEPLDRDSATLGALLAFRKTSATELSESTVRRDVRKEKTREFEQTATWAAVRKAWRAKTGKQPAYAQLPEVVIRSPKITGDKSTAWFAQNVDRRYRACLGRAGK